MIGGTLGQGAGGPAALVFARKSTPPLAIAAEARVEIALKENPPHVCEECGKSFPKNARLKEHKMTHQPRACKFCPKMFKSYSALRYFQGFKVVIFKLPISIRYHNTSVHDDSEFICLTCQKVLKSPENLRNHQKNNVCEKELNNKPFQCNQCHRKFKTKKVLTAHIKIKHAEEVDDD